MRDRRPAEHISIGLHTCGAAFDDAPATEAARILHQVAEMVLAGGPPPGTNVKLVDSNGNSCGILRIERMP